MSFRKKRQRKLQTRSQTGLQTGVQAGLQAGSQPKSPPRFTAAHKQRKAVYAPLGQPAIPFPVSDPQRFALELALSDAAREIAPAHYEDFQRLCKVLTQISGFRLYFAEVDSLPYRAQLIARLNELLPACGKSSSLLDLATHEQAMPFAEFEAQVTQAKPGSVLHVLNSEVWLDTHVAELNIRRNAIASQAHCALLWWLPHSAMQQMARMAPDAWSWRHGVFGFASGATTPMAALPSERLGNHAELLSSSLPQKNRRLATIRQLLQQDMEDEARFDLLLEMADILIATSHLNEAHELLSTQTLPLANRLLPSLPEAHALVMGRIGDILVAKGQWDDALHIRQKVELPVYEQLGDAYDIALTKDNIAHILLRKGELVQALASLRNEVIPAYQQLGKVRDQAIASGRIADILAQQGKVNEALRIRQKEQLPAYEMLGDVRSKAVVTSKIASILHRKGEADRAIRLYREQVLPVLEKIGDLEELVNCKVHLAYYLAMSQQVTDRDECQHLLQDAHTMATRLELPQRETIETIYLDIFQRPIIATATESAVEPPAQSFD